MVLRMCQNIIDLFEGDIAWIMSGTANGRYNFVSVSWLITKDLNT